MGASTKQCPHCASPLLQDHRFCPECGKPLPSDASSSAASKEVKKPSFKGTMLAYQVPTESVPKAVQPEPPPPVAPSPAAAEELNSAAGSKPATASEPDSSPAQTEPAPVPTAAEPPKKQLDKSKTILGLPGQKYSAAAPVAEPPAPQEPSSPEDKPESEGHSKPRAKTIFGMPGLVGAGGDLKPAASPASGSLASPSSDALSAHEKQGSVDSGSSAASALSQSANRTILGMPMAPPSGGDKVSAARAGEQKAEAIAPAASVSTSAGPAPETGRTILGVASYDEAATPPTPVQPSPVVPRFDEEAEEDEGDFEPTERDRSAKGAKPLFLGALVVFLIVAVAAVAAFLLMREETPNVRASVVRMEGGDHLLFEVPGAVSGSKIRFGGQEKPLDAGRATFLLATDSVRTGENIVMFDVISPDGKTESDTITLAVDFRVRVDMSPLQTAEPAIDVLVNALPGTTVTLDGKALQLDSEGRGTRRYPIDAAGATADGVVEHVVRYRVQPPSGEATVDELRTKILIASMQIDRPGLEAVTDGASIEIAGAVSPDAQVSVDGQSVSVQGGRFLYRLALPQVGVFQPKVIARETGKAPRAVTLNIRRVADLKKEAEGFEADSSLTYARIAQNPAIYSGQKVALEGRVFNVNVQSGQSVLQVLVRECSSGTRCSIWVTYPFATEAVVDSWVRVLGSVQGQQQFRSENNRVVTVPKIAATYVLPISQ